MEGRWSEAASVSASASASKSELREEVDEFIMGVADLDFVGVLGIGTVDDRPFGPRGAGGEKYRDFVRERR